MAEGTVPSTETQTGVRTATQTNGLMVRTIGLGGVFLFGLHCVNLAYAGVLPLSTVAGAWPGSNLPVILTLAVVLCMFHAYTYAVIGSAAPRSGADYVVATRTLSAPLGFATSWTMVILSAWAAGTLIAGIPRTTMPMLLRSLGIIFDSKQLVSLAQTASSTYGIILFGTMLTVMIYISMLLSTKTLVRFLQIGLVVGVLAWVIIYAQLLFPLESFEPAWDRFMGAGSYGAQVGLAEDAGMFYSRDMGATTLAGLLLGFWIFYGAFVPTLFAGEVKEPEKNLLRGSWLALGGSWAIFMLGVLLAQRLIPADWLAAQSYLYQHGSQTAMPWIIFYAAVLRPSGPLLVIVSGAWMLMLFNLAQTYFFYCSRVVLAWAEDGLMPPIVGYIHPRRRFPLVAMFLIAVVAQLGVTQAAQQGNLAIQLDFVLFVAVCQLLPVLAITLFPFVRRQQFESSKPFVRARVLGFPVISLVGVVTLAYLLWLIVGSFLYAADLTVLWLSVIALAAVLVLGVVWYFMRMARLRRLGVDGRETFTRFPQD